MELFNRLLVSLNPKNAANFEWHEGLPFMDIRVPYTACAIYLVTIYSLFQYRKSFKDPVRGPLIKSLLIVHNLFLSLGSAVLLYFIAKELLAAVDDHGVEPLICDVERKGRHLNKGPLLYYFYIFYLSKIYEFFDTIFVILKVLVFIIIFPFPSFITSNHPSHRLSL